MALSLLMIFAVYRVQSVYLEGLPEQVTRVDIYPQEITYRTGTYQTPTQLAIAFKATQDPPKVLALHYCEGIEVLEDIVEIAREQGISSFEITLPEDC